MTNMWYPQFYTLKTVFEKQDFQLQNISLINVSTDINIYIPIYRNPNGLSVASESAAGFSNDGNTFQRKSSIHSRSNRLRKDFNTRVSFNFHVHINMCFPRPSRPHPHPHLQGPALPRSNQHGFGERRRPEEAAGGDQEGEGESGEAGEGGEGAGEETGTARGREAAAWTEVNICPCPPLPSPSSPQPSPPGKATRWQRSSSTSIPKSKVARWIFLSTSIPKSSTSIPCPSPPSSKSQHGHKVKNGPLRFHNQISVHKSSK